MPEVPVDFFLTEASSPSCSGRLSLVGILRALGVTPGGSNFLGTTQRDPWVGLHLRLVAPDTMVGALASSHLPALSVSRMLPHECKSLGGTQSCCCAACWNLDAGCTGATGRAISGAFDEGVSESPHWRFVAEIFGQDFSLASMACRFLLGSRASSPTRPARGRHCERARCSPSSETCRIAPAAPFKELDIPNTRHSWKIPQDG